MMAAEDFACSFCGKGKKSEQKITKHLAKNHIRWTPFECLLCEKFRYFESLVAVETHLQEAHFVKTNPDKEKELELKAHIENSRHSYQNPEVCEFCKDLGVFEEESQIPETYTSTEEKKTHVLRHFCLEDELKHEKDCFANPKFLDCMSGCFPKFFKKLPPVKVEKVAKKDSRGNNSADNYQPHKCKFCDKLFQWPESLRSHENIHKGVKPYACQFCPRTFNWRSNKRSHENIHKGVKPYECKICSKKFTSPGGLYHHKWTHTDDKPYKCRYCTKSFSERKNKFRHERSQHEEFSEEEDS